MGGTAELPIGTLWRMSSQNATYISEFVPSSREPLIVQEITAVEATGGASEGDGAHAQQGDAHHLRVHNNTEIRLEDSAHAKKPCIW